MNPSSAIVLEAFGLRLGVGGLNPREIRQLRRRFPLAWDFAPFRPGTRIDRWFRMPPLNPKSEGGPARVDVIGNHMQMHLARNARTHVLVHAGAVLWNGHCLVLPGPSGSGKSTLVHALIRAGAAYMSDEYAAIDESGLIHPYARPLALKSRTGDIRRVDPGNLTTLVASPQRPALILETSFSPGARFSPEPLDPLALIALLARNSAAPLQEPEAALRAFSRATKNARGLTSRRGPVGGVVRWLREAFQVE